MFWLCSASFVPMNGAKTNTLLGSSDDAVDFSSPISSSESLTETRSADLELLATANSRYRRIEESAVSFFTLK